MNSTAPTPGSAAGSATGNSGGSRALPRSFAARVARYILGRWAARVGLIWIGFIALLAVFAPFVANSHPILMVTDNGDWSSPMLEHLTASDVILVVGFFAAIVLVLLRWMPPGRRMLIWLIVIVLTSGLAYNFVQPSSLVLYSQYREGLADGSIRTAVFTVIPYSPVDRMRDSARDTRKTPPSARHWMGTTTHGEDLASRMIHASRIALAIGFIATGIAVVLGIFIGGLMGYFSGIVDLLGMRLVEIFSAVPTLFLLIAIVNFYERNIYLMMVIIGLTGWVGYALFIRAEFLKLRQQDFVQAAIACGLPLRSVLFRHMLPNGVTPVLVNASFGVAGAILTESTLSFLGLGLKEEPSWGQMLNQARTAGEFLWWMGIYPGLAIFLTVLAYNLIGEALRDAIDPQVNKD